MSAVAYQCPCCGAPLAYGAESGKLECASCSNSYELDALEAMQAPQEEGGFRFDISAQTFDKGEAEQMHAYLCQGCGAVNKGKFCSECGAKKPAGAPLYQCDKCGFKPADPQNPPKFCPECGDVFDEGDVQ